MSDTRLLVVHTRSPLHAGTGQSTAAVDLPIARDRATSHPLLPGSSIKGSLRNVCRDVDPPNERNLFGPDTTNASDHAGSMAFSDARLLLLPVRSLAGTFAWVTCPWVLGTLRREATHCGLSFPDTPTAIDRERTWVTGDTSLVVSKEPPTVVLEEHDLRAERRPEADAWAKALGEALFDDDWAKLLFGRLCIVHDDVFTFLAQHGTEVTTRVRIDPDTGTARGGQLWTEENLPTESVLTGIVQATPHGKARDWSHDVLFDKLDGLLERTIQLGGKATVGRGRCSLSLVGG